MNIFQILRVIVMFLQNAIHMPHVGDRTNNKNTVLGYKIPTSSV